MLLIQPLKVFAMAMFVALVLKKLEDEDKSEIEKQVKSLAKNEKWLNKLDNETSIFDRVETFSIEPPDFSKLDTMRTLRLKERKMYSISREIGLYLFFTFIVFMIGYFTREPQAYFQTRDVEELFRLKLRKDSQFKSATVFKQVKQKLLSAKTKRSWYVSTNPNPNPNPFSLPFNEKFLLGRLKEKYQKNFNIE